MNVFNLKDRPTVSIKCNWEVNIPGKTVEDTVLINFQKDEDEGDHNEEDINDILDVEKTVNFTRPETNQDKPILNFKIPKNEEVYFGAITLLCDSKVIEVFGDHHIYLETIYGNVIEEGEDFNGYEFKIDFAKIINKEISIRFIKLSSPANFWIYGTLLKLRKLKKRFASICYENVEDLIKEVQISEPASKCLKFLRNSSNDLEFPISKSPLTTSPDFLRTNGELKSLNLIELKQYIDYKFQVLTEFLILREKNTNDKLDTILEYLKSNHNKSINS